MSTKIIENFEAMLAQGKDSAMLRFGLGQGYLQAGVADRAIEHLNAAIAQKRDYSAAWKLLAKAYEQTGDAETALARYREGIEVAQQHGDLQAAKEMMVFARRLEKQLAG